MWRRMWCVKERITVFLIRNIDNYKTLTNNISSSYWTRNRVCREEQKKCRNQKQCSQDEDKFTGHEAETEKQRWSSDKNYHKNLSHNC